MLSNSLTQRILPRFPKIQYCFAYGSGVKRQVGYDEKAQKNAMIDLIVAVDDATKWHKENLERNPHDYSWMRFLGSKLIGEYQEYAAGVYCNTLIQLDRHTTIKYGVIRMQDLKDDLWHWNHLYVAGRLQKPVETLIQPNDPELIENLAKNFENALHTALLQLPQEFSYFQLFHAIAKISYTGDFRMYFGERKDKIYNIVDAQLEDFLKLYKRQLRALSDCVHVPDLSKTSNAKIQQCKSRETTLKHLQALPERVLDILKMTNGSVEALPDIPKELHTALVNINWENSVGQSMKNIPTAGIFKSIKYAGRKAMKTFSK
ncbi:phosphatidate cytidylyltransferase, mitochondrial [Contarinia nasturtii]|uniref:phosphatidate cytidylyltransferase, mitochondrial n=1 Tax=Contarinia nasturtii TaxID=265458 RepID=UPI0012D43A1E|nr:phosphatidate cytidylyltransferase, mitochondrial [Contarinia nasturtii]